MHATVSVGSQGTLGGMKRSPTDKIGRIGLVARDYRVVTRQGTRDFSDSIESVLGLLDSLGCEAALFSLYALAVPHSRDDAACFDAFKNLRLIVLEEFEDHGGQRRPLRCVVHERSSAGWRRREIVQAFGTRAELRRSGRTVPEFIARDLPSRLAADSCLLICGELNAVQYSRSDRTVRDPFDFRAAIPRTARVILNPVHDRMVGWEMMRKRRYLSAGGRWVLSVWNKGKVNRCGLGLDWHRPPWTVFYDGWAVRVEPIVSCERTTVEVGVVNVLAPPTSDRPLGKGNGRES